MKYKCIPYIMKYEKYEESPYRGMYIDITRWCNQPSLFKKQSIREWAAYFPEHYAASKYLKDFERKLPHHTDKEYTPCLTFSNVNPTSSISFTQY